MAPKMALIRVNGGLNIIIYVRDPKRHILGRNHVVWRILRQNLSRALGCSELQEPKINKKTNTFWCAKSRMRGNETPGRIVTNFCTCPRRNHLYRFVLRSLMGFWRGGWVKFWLSPLTCFVALTTLSLYRASVWSVIKLNSNSTIIGLVYSSLKCFLKRTD